MVHCHFQAIQSLKRRGNTLLCHFLAFVTSHYSGIAHSFLAM
jgi:hypothetical protein